MTKKAKHWRGRSRTSASVIKTINKDSFASAICPTNVEEQKKKFLELGKTPEFTHRGTEDELEEIYSKPRSEIRFDLLGEALHILKTVKEKYGDAENYYTEMYGDKITKLEATDIIVDYLKENHLDGAMSVIWCTDLPCSGRMMWQGPNVKYRRPEARKYSMWIKDSKDNNFLRELGIRCLADHEIGTHFFRSYNDGLQPWFSERSRFGIRGLSGLEQLRTEEGLAACNTILNARVRYLWGPALLYYIACKATEMSFKQLFEHLSIYVQNPEWRWRHCVRVKRGLLNPNDIGGYGKDQCYFEGAVEILRNLETIDFKILMCGKICYDECDRVKKLARLDCIQLPAFMKNQEKYKKSLKQIAHMNGLHLQHGKFKAPMAYLRKLKRGRRIGVAGGSNKVRKKGRKGGNSRGKGGVGVSTRGEGGSGDEEEESGDEETYFFQHYNMSENVKKSSREGVFYQSESTNTQNILNDLSNFNEKNSLDYYKKFVDQLEKRDWEKEEKEESYTRHKGDRRHKPEIVSNKFTDSDTECSPTNRCVSRASIHSLLNLRSFSLNSRINKNANADDQDSYSTDLSVRPGSGFGDSLGSSALCDPVAPDLPPNKPNSLVPLSHIPSSKSHDQQTGFHSYNNIQSHDHQTGYHTNSNIQDIRPPWSNMLDQRSLLSGIYMPSDSDSNKVEKTTSGYRPPTTTALLHKSMSTQNCIKTEPDGFIYPNTDILTDDMIKVKDGNQSGEMSTNMEPDCQKSANGEPLLNRRVKSAANMLQKFRN